MSTEDASSPALEPPRIRVGVLLDDLRVPRWVADVLSSVATSADSELSVAVLNGAANRRVKRIPAFRYWTYEAYSRIDRKLFLAKNDPFARVHLEELDELDIAAVDQLKVTPRQKRFSDYFEPADLEQLLSYDLDVLLRFGFRILRGRVLRLPRYGVWSFHHGNPDTHRGGPPGFWEVFENRPTTGVVLQVLSERLDGGAILERGETATKRRSVIRNKTHLFWLARSFVERSLARLHRSHAGRPLEDDSHDGNQRRLQGPIQGIQSAMHRSSATVAAYSSPLYRKPTNSIVAPLLVKLARRMVSGKLDERVHASRWSLWYSRDRRADLIPPLYRQRELAPPPGRYWADPFIVHHDDEPFVFFEDFDLETRRGRIAGLRLAAEDSGGVFPVLELPHHLSYPFTFRWKNDLFMVPEGAQTRSVALYRCRRFPDDWDHVATLLQNVRAVDPTLHWDGQRWWLFVGEGSEEATHCNDELHLYSAQHIEGPYVPHPQNPIVSTVTRARPAGSLISWSDSLYRPGQDCSGRYGGALSLFEIEELTPTSYRERFRVRLEPRWMPGVQGIHTLNVSGNLMVTDGLMSRWRRRSSR